MATMKLNSARLSTKMAVRPTRMAVRVKATEGEAVEVDAAVNAVIGAVKTTGDYVKTGVDVLSAGVDVLKKGYEVAAPVVKQGIDAATPVASELVKQATPLVKQAVPVVEDALKQATSAVTSNNIITQVQDIAGPVVKTAAQGATAAAPVVNQLLSTSSPVLLAEYAVGAVALLYLAPPVFGLLFGSLRGYAGSLTAVNTLEVLSTDSSAVLVDLRTDEDKERSGIPDVPGGVSSRCIEVEVASITDKKLRSNVNNAGAIEIQITALQIAALKKVTKGSKIVLIDKNGSVAPGVAKELGAKGFGKVYVVAGGFDGRSGWVQSKLQIKPYAGGSAPSLPIGTRIGTLRKGLPAPK